MEKAAGSDVHAFVYEASSSERLDKALAGALPDLSRSWLKGAIGRGAVAVNGRPAAKAGQKIRRGDRVEVQRSADDAAAAALRTQTTFRLEANAEVPLAVLWEDASVVVLDKPKGLVMHPSRENGRNFDDSLCAGLLARYGHEGLAPSDDGLRPGIVHRLDADTSGVVVVARTADALQHLQSQFRDNKAKLKREYVALTAGGFGRGAISKGTIDAPIGRHPRHGTRRCVRELGGANVKTAVTHWEAERTFADGRVALMRCRLDTGRTHQIRVHMKHVHHALLCDPLYGPGNMPCAALEPRLAEILEQHRVTGQYLHAQTLSFEHPQTGEFMSFEAPLPAYWREALAYLEGQE